MKKVELLSPAGNLEKLKIAIDFGADAVYGGVSHFSLRIRSGKEFSMEEFKEGIDYAHERGKKVYVTINGFPFNSQLNLLKKHIVAMAELQPDAFIVATPGVLKLCHDLAPHMPTAPKLAAMFGFLLIHDHSLSCWPMMGSGLANRRKHQASDGEFNLRLIRWRMTCLPCGESFHLRT